MGENQTPSGLFLMEKVSHAKGPYLARQLSVSGLGVQALTSNKSVCPLIQMVMQENTGNLYWFGPMMPYVQ